MATLVFPGNARVVWQEGQGATSVLIELKNVTAADTLDISSVVQVILAATLVGTAGPAAGAAAVASFSGTTVTIPAGPSHSAGLLLVFGVAA